MDGPLKPHSNVIDFVVIYLFDAKNEENSLQMECEIKSLCEEQLFYIKCDNEYTQVKINLL